MAASKSPRIRLLQDAAFDRRLFELDQKRWAKFIRELATPPKKNPRLRKLLARRPDWK
jgi:uncharacterized protein (DUF1778 family)